MVFLYGWHEKFILLNNSSCFQKLSLIWALAVHIYTTVSFVSASILFTSDENPKPGHCKSINFISVTLNFLLESVEHTLPAYTLDKLIWCSLSIGSGFTTLFSAIAFTCACLFIFNATCYFKIKERDQARNTILLVIASKVVSSSINNFNYLSIF